MTQKALIKNSFVAWLPLAVVIIIVSGMVYMAEQQNYRMSANDPQIQIAEDISEAIVQGRATPDAIVPATPSASISQGLSAFVTIYDDTGKPIGSSVALDGKLPEMPKGVVDFVKQKGEERFTWEPQKGVRIAAVVKHFGGKTPGYVLAGRSLREIELREKNLMMLCGFGMLAALLVSYLCFMFVVKQLAHLFAPHEHHAEGSTEHHHEHTH